MKRRTFLAALAAAALACAGIGAAIAATSETTGTVSVCATASTPSHTVAVDGVNVSTLAGDAASQCATTTYTVPTVTDTVTVGSTTTAATTTVQTTTTTSSSPTFASETAYTQNRPAFTAKRTVMVSSASELKTALSNLQPGDLVEASAPFTVSAGGTSDALVISNRLSAPAEIDLTGVTVEYTGTGNYDSVWIKNVQNVWLFGGNITMTQPTLGGGACIAWFASQHSMWWGFDAHDCGSNGLSMFTGKPGYSFTGPVSYDDIEGTIHHFSLNGGMYDPHTEKCSGLHGANLADGNYYSFDHNRIALNVSDSACTGGGIEFGSSMSPTTSTPGPIPDSDTIILQCDSLTFVSTIQTGGNCYQTWGYGETHTDIKYLVASNLTGHPYFAGGMYGAAGATALSTDTVEYGRATNVRQNPLYANDPNWDTKGGTVFEDVAPLP